MYDLKLAHDELIILICDDAIINDKLYTAIITNKSLYILDYPSKVHNAWEDLRTSGRVNYIKKKEVIFSSPISDIKNITKDKITFVNDSILQIKCDTVINEIKKITKEI